MCATGDRRAPLSTGACLHAGIVGRTLGCASQADRRSTGSPSATRANSTSASGARPSGRRPSGRCATSCRATAACPSAPCATSCRATAARPSGARPSSHYATSSADAHPSSHYATSCGATAVRPSGRCASGCRAAGPSEHYPTSCRAAGVCRTTGPAPRARRATAAASPGNSTCTCASRGNRRISHSACSDGRIGDDCPVRGRRAVASGSPIGCNRRVDIARVATVCRCGAVEAIPVDGTPHVNRAPFPVRRPRAVDACGVWRLERIADRAIIAFKMRAVATSSCCGDDEQASNQKLNSHQNAPCAETPAMPGPIIGVTPATGWTAEGQPSK